MSVLLAVIATLLPAAVVCAVRAQRRCDRLNAAADVRDEDWRHLTDEDREWLLENGATRPSFARWELR